MTTNFGNDLFFSRPRHDGKTTAEAFGVSVFFHITVAVAVVWLSFAPPHYAKPDQQQHIIIPVLEEEKAQEALPPPPPPPPDNRAYEQTVADAPRGFQTLTVPTYISPEIPPPTAGPEINEADFSGEGVEGGRAGGRVDPNAKIVTGEDISAAPAFTPYTVAPELRNREEIGTLLQDMYPRLLRDAGIGGRVIMWIFVDANGQVRNTRVNMTSQLPELDSAAVRVSRRMQFRPAQNRDVRVPVWVSIPVVFSVAQ
jgi:protein TonB